MSIVNVTHVEVGKNPAPLTENFQLGVVFECLENLQEDLEWRLIYVGTPNSNEWDQELDCVALGPVKRGALRFQFDAPAPDFSKIPKEDINEITVVLLTGSYRNQEFIRIGWYVHNVYTDPELQNSPPDEPQIDKMERKILTDDPRVTRFNIDWEGTQQAASSHFPMTEQPVACAPCDIGGDVEMS
eukprot:Selendium_serpulae@DN6448_c0_g1_i17.p1